MQQPRPLTRRELEVYLWMVRDTMTVAEVLAAKLRAMEVIAGMEATGLPIQERSGR